MDKEGDGNGEIEMKIFYFKKNTKKTISALCLAMVTCWGMWSAYLGEPLVLYTGAGLDLVQDEGVSIALKIEDNPTNTGETVMKLARELKKKHLTDINLFFTKAWVQKYPEAYHFVVEKGFETGVWWYDKDTLHEKPVEIEYAKIYIMQTAEMMSNLAGKTINLYLESNLCSEGERTNVSKDIPYAGVCADVCLDGKKVTEKMALVEESAQIGMIYSDSISANTVSELEQFREVLQSKNIEIVKISVNQKQQLSGEQKEK